MYATHAFTIGTTMMAVINMAGKNIMQEKPWCYADSKDDYHHQCQGSLYGYTFFQK
jgi:hypothetical protein